MNKARRAMLQKAIEAIDEARALIEECRELEQEAFDNMPESGRLSSKCNSSEYLEGSKPTKAFSGSVIDQIQDALKLFLRYTPKIAALGVEKTK